MARSNSFAKATLSSGMGRIISLSQFRAEAVATLDKEQKKASDKRAGMFFGF
jgi:hypothetical protein